jgi:hypothetical protein
VKKKPKFKDIQMNRLMCLTTMLENALDIRIQTDQVELGTALCILEVEIDSGKS